MLRVFAPSVCRRLRLSPLRPLSFPDRLSSLCGRHDLQQKVALPAPALCSRPRSWPEATSGKTGLDEPNVKEDPLWVAAPHPRPLFFHTFINMCAPPNAAALKSLPRPPSFCVAGRLNPETFWGAQWDGRRGCDGARGRGRAT